MNFINKMQLPRRTFLRGAGGVLALPLLDAMIPALGKAAVTESPTRMAILYFPNGVQPEAWDIASNDRVDAVTGDVPRLSSASRDLPR